MQSQRRDIPALIVMVDNVIPFMIEVSKCHPFFSLNQCSNIAHFSSKILGLFLGGSVSVNLCLLGKSKVVFLRSASCVDPRDLWSLRNSVAELSFSNSGQVGIVKVEGDNMQFARSSNFCRIPGDCPFFMKRNS